MAEEVKKWRSIDQTNRPIYLSESDKCYYYMDYQARGGHSSSNSNSLISNFKKDPRYKGQAPWRYKLDAVNLFAKNLIELFGNDRELMISFIPGSKKKDDLEYDERFDLLKEALLELNPRLKFEEPIVVKSSREATHVSDKRLKPAEIKETYNWQGFSGTVEAQHLILIDDVITTGAQFRAYSEMVLEHHENLDIYGIFWGKSFWLSDFSTVDF